MPSAGRVIAGRARGLRLAAPGDQTRPLADRVKETLFAILEPELLDARFLDCCAGSGAAGIEALSRGAALAVFVERDQRAVAAIERNLAHTRLAAGARVVRGEALAYLRGRGGEDGPFDVVFVDPPYAATELTRSILALLADPGAMLLADRAVVVVKHFWRDTPPDRIGLLASFRERRFGETALTFYRREPAPVPPEAGAQGDLPAGPATTEDAGARGARQR